MVEGTESPRIANRIAQVEKLVNKYNHLHVEVFMHVMHKNFYI
jgi:tryptophanase